MVIFSILFFTLSIIFSIKNKHLLYHYFSFIFLGFLYTISMLHLFDAPSIEIVRLLFSMIPIFSFMLYWYNRTFLRLSIYFFDYVFFFIVCGLFFFGSSFSFFIKSITVQSSFFITINLGAYYWIYLICIIFIFLSLILNFYRNLSEYKIHLR